MSDKGSVRVQFVKDLPVPTPATNITFTQDETASDDPAVLAPHTGHYQIRREPLDERWEWVEITRMQDAGPTYMRGRCRHLEVVPVESTDGETVAHLCTTCDSQLPKEWKP